MLTGASPINCEHPVQNLPRPILAGTDGPISTALAATIPASPVLYCGRRMKVWRYVPANCHCNTSVGADAPGDRVPEFVFEQAVRDHFTVDELGPDQSRL